MAEVLAEHRIVWESDGDYGEKQWVACTCSHLSFGDDYWTGETQADHEAHVAEVLAANGYGKLTLVQLAERDRPESMEAARAQVRAERREAQAETIRRAKAKALEDAAEELARLQGIGRTAQGKCSPEEKADYYAYAEHDGDHSAWLKARAATERGAA